MSEIQSDSINNSSENEDDGEIIPYYKANRTSISIQKKEYYLKNKQKILQKIKCECGKFICKNQINRHKRTKIHKTYLCLLNIDNSKEVNFD